MGFQLDFYRHVSALTVMGFQSVLRHSQHTGMTSSNLVTAVLELMLLLLAGCRRTYLDQFTACLLFENAMEDC